MADWDSIDKEFARSKYLEEGEYKTKVIGVELEHSKVKGTPGFTFTLEPVDGASFPKYGATQWLSLTNENWRMYHFKQLLIVFGIKEDAAKKAIEMCEAKESNEDKEKAYLDTIKRAVSKKPEVYVAVFKEHKDDRFPTWDFASNDVRMNYPAKDDYPTVPYETNDSILATAEDSSAEISLDDMPF